MSRRILAAACTAAAAGALTIGMTTAALASPSGGNPNPTPTVTETTPPPVVCPPGTVLVGDKCVPVRVNPLQQQEFDVIDNNLLPNGWVLGTGPIDIKGGIDKTTPNPRVDFFDTADQSSGVRINHEPLSGAVIDRATCSITFDQSDLPWSIHFGFGRFAGATGNGLYSLVGLFSFPTVRNHCTLPWWLTSAQADWDINHGTGLPDPLAFNVDVQAVGRSFVPSPKPQPCPTRSVFAPVNGTPSPWDTCSPDPTRSVFAPTSG